MTEIVLFGCGALGSNIINGIVRPNDKITLHDDDKVDVVNVATGTTIYSSEHIGRNKASALATILSRRYGVQCIPKTRTLNFPIAIKDSALVIDCFDNIKSRAWTMVTGQPTIHVSIGEQHLGAIEWDDIYQLPESGYKRGENPVCTNELGRDLILFTSTVASIIINKYLSSGVKESAYVMLDSLEIFK